MFLQEPLIDDLFLNDLPSKKTKLNSRHSDVKLQTKASNL